VIGTAFGCALTNAAYAERLATGGPAAASPRLFAATVSNAAAGELAIAYRLGGPCVTLSAGGAAGLVALAHAVDLLRTGQADALVAGGADAAGGELDGAMVGEGLCAPADAVALLVLEPLVAGRRPARGVILGCAAGFGADALPDVVDDALEDARTAPSDVAVVVGHGLEGPFAVRPEGERQPAVVAATSGAGGPIHLLRALATVADGGVIVVVDACPSGHVAALVARKGAA
jgi:3-oxoacyl-(acyl-carrier-protein) synthase